MRYGLVLGTCSMALAAAMAGAPLTAAMAHTPQNEAQADSVQEPEQFGDIVVTAQRRSERGKDVPVALIARTGDDLVRAGVADVRGLEMIAPSLKIVRSGAYTQPAIRGVTSVSTAPGTDPNVAIYLDGVYQPNQSNNSFELPDVERIEVLKGPQGTLFGRNATGGAIQIITRAPSFTPTGRLSASYGNYNNLVLSGFVSGPLTDDVAAISLSAYHEEHDGYTRDLLKGGRRTGKLESNLLRGKLLLHPSESVSLLLSVAHMERNDPSTFLGIAHGGNSMGRGAAVLARKPYQVSSNFAPIMKTRSTTGSLQATIEVGDSTITSTTAYTDARAHLGFDGDYSPLPVAHFELIQPDENFVQEINFASDPGKPLRFVAGLFYYRDKTGYDPNVATIGAATIISRSNAKTTAAAGYVDVTFDATDRLTLIGGLRYSWERKSLAGSREAAGPLSFISRKSWDSLTPRVAMRYALSPATNIYASYNRGFKSGAYNVSGLAPDPVDPEKIDAYEVGLKTAGRMFSGSLAGFYYRYGNQQVQAQQGTFNILQNAATSDIYGIEAEGSLRLGTNWRITGGVAWLDARYDKFPGATVLVPLPDGGNGNEFRDLAGYRMARSPEWTGSLQVDYRRQTAIGDVGLSGTLYYSDAYRLEPLGRVTQDAYALLNLRATVEPAAAPGFSVALWGKNLTDKAVIQSVFIANFADGVHYAMPRTYGVTLGYEF